MLKLLLLYLCGIVMQLVILAGHNVCTLQNMLVSFPICLVLLRFLPEGCAQLLALPEGQDKVERGNMFRDWSALFIVEQGMSRLGASAT